MTWRVAAVESASERAAAAADSVSHATPHNAAPGGPQERGEMSHAWIPAFLMKIFHVWRRVQGVSLRRESG